MSRHTLASAYGFAVRVFTIAVCLAALAVAWRILATNPAAIQRVRTYPEKG